jgi:hypothetical protein
MEGGGGGGGGEEEAEELNLFIVYRLKYFEVIA